MHERVRGRRRSREDIPDGPAYPSAPPRLRRRGDDEVKGLVHTLVCPACHAIQRETLWFVDEALYAQMDGQPGVWPRLCPGCLRVARGVYEGEVLLQSALLIPTKSVALNVISNEEERARCRNPMSRLTAIEDRGDELVVLTTTTILAERIGKAFHRIYEGDLEISRPPTGNACRVRWFRE
jgi:hypothetical protein